MDERTRLLLENKRMAAEVSAANHRSNSHLTQVARLKAQLRAMEQDIEYEHLRGRAAALYQASEFLMDHGAIRTGGDLVAVCEQIKNLKKQPTKIEAAVDALGLWEQLKHIPQVSSGWGKSIPELSRPWI